MNPRHPRRSPVPPRPAARRGLVLLAGAILAAGTWLVACRSQELPPEVSRVKADLELLRDAVTRYKAAHRGLAPESLQELLAPASQGSAFLPEGLPVDPWRNPYVYRRSGDDGSFNVLCLGRDGLEGGWGEDADIDLEMLRSGRI